MKGYYSPDDVAELLGLHVRTIRRFIREGKLKATRIGKQYRITAEALNGFVGSHRKASVPLERRQRRALVSTTVDVDAMSSDEAQRISSTLTAVFGSTKEGPRGKSLECIYYEEQGQLRIVINADLNMTTAILGLISGLVDS